MIMICAVCAIVGKIRGVFYEANKYSTHAEKNAISKIKNKHILRECKVYIIKIKNNEINHAVPCEMCSQLLKKYKITKIFTTHI